MKKTLILLFVLLVYQAGHTQNQPATTPTNSTITPTGISLPQLITTDLNRSELQFGINLSDGLKRPNLTTHFNKFISDNTKQFSFNAGFTMRHTFSLDNNDALDFYQIDGLALNIGAELKLFNTSDYFIQIGTQNWIDKPGGLSEFDFFGIRNSVTLGIGKGRIDFVNDGAVALAIVEKLAKYGVVNRSLTELEYTLLVEKINELKNRRKFVNRSYPLTESEEIHDLLNSFGIVSADIDITPILDDAYRYEPMIDRTVGSQFSLSVTGTNYQNNIFTDFNSKSLTASISYMIHSPISTKWQYNKGVRGYITAAESNFDNPEFLDSKIRRVGVGATNDIHYLLDNKMRLSFLSTVGYDFIRKVNTFNPVGDPYFNNDGMYLNLRTEFEYQISRTMSTTYGINLDITPDNTFTGMSLGLKF